MIRDNGRKISTRLSSGVIIGLLVIGLVGIQGCAAKRQWTNTKTVEDQIKTVCEVIEKSTRETYQGVGVARVSIYTEAPTPGESTMDFATGEMVVIKPAGPEIQKHEEEFLVNFAFKGQSSRADLYEVVDRNPGNLLESLIYTPETTFRYVNGKYVKILTPPSMLHSYYKHGYNFHPEAIIRFDGIGFVKKVETFLKAAKTINTKSTDEDLFAIDIEGSKIYPHDQYVATLTLDPKANFRPVYYRIDGENTKAGITGHILYEAEWKQYASIWYITDLRYETASSYNEGLKGHGKEMVDIHIENFDPKAEVKDSQFTLESLNIPIGTEVRDQKKGLVYKYK